MLVFCSMKIGWITLMPNDNFFKASLHNSYTSQILVCAGAAEDGRQLLYCCLEPQQTRCSNWITAKNCALCPAQDVRPRHLQELPPIFRAAPSNRSPSAVTWSNDLLSTKMPSRLVSQAWRFSRQAQVQRIKGVPRWPSSGHSSPNLRSILLLQL